MNKKTYQCPQLTVVAFRNEHGYASSGPVGVPMADRLELLFSQGVNDRNETEAFSTHGSWNESNGNNFWQ